jgi:DNA-binding response OmpR family regulator
MQKATILIVEDEALLSEAYTTILQKEGFKTISAFDGKEALDIVLKQPVDLILLDLRMPHMNGLEFLKEFSKQKDVALPKTIVFSNYDVQIDIEESFKYGAERYMLKAWASPKELVKVIEDTLEN